MVLLRSLSALIVLALVLPASSRTAFVHLFEWSWDDIAKECEQHLGPKRFAAVQVSPPQKSVDRPEWWSRYQPLSYAVEGRSGTRSQFRSMVKRCAMVGVDIYVDAIINHMAALDRSFPEVPYSPNDFHTCVTPINYNNRFEVQNCDLVGLNDLKTESEYVRGRIAAYMNDLIGLGVKGFRIDAAKHMPSADIAAIIAKLDKPVYIFQEVIGAGGEPVQPAEYVGNAAVTEFNFERTLGFYFKGRGPLKELRNIVNFDGWLNSDDAVVFVSNHDDQRQNTFNTLTYKDVRGLYYIGEIFSLAYPYGYPKVMSSYFFEDHDQGPPSKGVHSGARCGEEWVCEHRWRGIANMVKFREVCSSEFRLTNWWDNGNHQIAFGRGGQGFVVINREDGDMDRVLDAGMAAGRYCDIVNGEFEDGVCSGDVIEVGSNGKARFQVKTIGAAAIHVGTRVGELPKGFQDQRIEDKSSEVVKVKFTCNNAFVRSGQSVFAIGSVDELGRWKVAKAVKLVLEGRSVWSGYIDVGYGKRVEWKCLKRDDTEADVGIEWESGDNNVFVSSSVQQVTGEF
ncbi:ATPase [Gracilaria domingensis]|nr:ATPase [Gracilaria domingensis]